MKPGHKLILTCPLCRGNGDVYQCQCLQYQHERQDAYNWRSIVASVTPWHPSVERLREYAQDLSANRGMASAIVQAMADALQAKSA